MAKSFSCMLKVFNIQEKKHIFHCRSHNYCYSRSRDGLRKQAIPSYILSKLLCRCKKSSKGFMRFGSMIFSFSSKKQDFWLPLRKYRIRMFRNNRQTKSMNLNKEYVYHPFYNPTLVLSAKLIGLFQFCNCGSTILEINTETFVIYSE